MKIIFVSRQALFIKFEQKLASCSNEIVLIKKRALG